MTAAIGQLMNFTSDYKPRSAAITALFTESFTASEGAEEGALIGALVRDMLDTPEDDLAVFLSLDADWLTGGICFSRLSFPRDPRRVFLLSPVAVATADPGKGVGQALLRHGLQTLKARGVDVAVTYGDPTYYGKVGFRPVTTDSVAPPQPLTQPEGWLVQSLDGAPLAPLQGPSTCVAALNDPGYW